MDLATTPPFFFCPESAVESQSSNGTPSNAI